MTRSCCSFIACVGFVTGFTLSLGAARADEKQLEAAAQRKKHVDAVIAVLDAARGTYEKCNDTPEQLAKAIGGPNPQFDSLRVVSLADAGLGVKAKRESDPFDAAFYEHLSHINTLEDLVVMHTTAQDEWLAPLGKLKSLKSLRFINQAKLTDAGLAHLAGLNQLEAFSYIGTKMTGEPFQNFHGWTNLKRSSYRGSNMSEAGLIALCAAFPNLESLVLAHGHYTDEAVTHVAQLKRLTGLEIGSNKATPACLKSIVGLPLEYLQIGSELNVSDAVAIIREIKTLKRLSLTYCPTMTDDDLQKVAAMKHLESLELGNLPIPPERLPLMREFGFLKTLRTTDGRTPHTAETQTQLKAQLPGVVLVFQ